MIKNSIVPHCASLLLLAIQIQKTLTLHTKFRHTLLFVLTLYILKNTKHIKYAALFIVSCIFLYWPFSHSYGVIDASQIASFLQSEPNEILAFLGTISTQQYLFSAFLIFVGCFYFLYLPKTASHITLIKIFGVCLFLVTLYHTHFLRLFENAYANYNKENDLLISSKQQTDQWTITGNPKKNKTIVVIIGESVRKDYLSVYGYPLVTTPFLNKAPGLFIDGYISASFNTVDSLSRTLAKSDGTSFEPNNNVVTLANKAGYETSWISNQGYIGKYDTPSAAIGIKSHHAYFLNKGDFLFKTSNDDNLLSYLEDALSQQRKKVVFLHMSGSHEDVCQRLFDSGIQFQRHQGKQLDCYLSSIKRLDHFLEKTYQMVAAQSANFSIIYFSDHGLTIRPDNISGTLIKHGNDYRQDYSVPLIVLGSDYRTHQFMHRDLSATHFINMYAHELDIRTTNLPQESFTKPIEQSDIQVWNGKQLIHYSHLVDNLPME